MELQGEAGMHMRQEPKEPLQCAESSQHDRDPQRILELIEQLDLDLIETEKNASESE